MKSLLYVFTALFCGGLLSCAPDKDEFQEMGIVDMGLVKEIKLRVSHYQLLADGKAQLEFDPLLTTDEGFVVHDSRVDHSRIEYYTASGEVLEKNFSTTDKALAGREITVHAKIKGRDLVSNSITFTVADPSAMDTYGEVTIPVVFHLIQSNDDVNGYGGEIPGERIYLLLDKMNNTFSGSVSQNAVGVDTKVRFKAAVYDPYGVKLREPGINRILVDKVSDEAKDKYQTVVRKNKALWPHDKYLNIWLVSDRGDEYRTFGYTISTLCIPRYTYAGTGLPGRPRGLTLSEVPAGWDPAPLQTGLMYKLQSIQMMTRPFGLSNENELVNYVGSYFGLLPTWGASSSKQREDYCTDTHKYFGNDNNGYLKNTTQYKLTGDCFYLAENIMDDPVGVHRSISLQQALRVRWVLENCPERSAWQSDFAFTGK